MLHGALSSYWWEAAQNRAFWSTVTCVGGSLGNSGVYEKSFYGCSTLFPKESGREWAAVGSFAKNGGRRLLAAAQLRRFF